MNLHFAVSVRYITSNGLRYQSFIEIYETWDTSYLGSRKYEPSIKIKVKTFFIYFFLYFADK